MDRVSSGRLSPELNIYRNVYHATSKRFNGTWNLLLRWKGSVFKLMWHDLVIFLVVYFLLSALYRTVLFGYPAHREAFELMCIYAGKFSNVIPISFLTGFYVTQVVTRWWDQFMSLPWPDKIAMKMVAYVPGKDPFRKNLRRTVMRYINLSTVLVYRLISNKVQNRFPDYNALVEAKLILPHEVDRLRRADTRTPHESTWTPILWAVKLIQRARTEGKIAIEAPVYANLISSIDYIEGCNRKILNYGWVNFPLAYTQVATVSVYTYFLAALFGRQFLVPKPNETDAAIFPHLEDTFTNQKPFDFHTPDFYVPFFTIIEFLSYMGWIKVAETLLNPFGDDDEDLKVNYIIDRNLQVSYLIVDEAEEEMEMEQDPFLEAGYQIPEVPPYSEKQPPEKPRSTLKDLDSVSLASSMREGANLLEKLRDSFRSNAKVKETASPDEVDQDDEALGMETLNNHKAKDVEAFPTVVVETPSKEAAAATTPKPERTPSEEERVNKYRDRAAT